MKKYWLGPFTIISPEVVYDNHWIEVVDGIISNISTQPNTDSPQLNVHGANIHLYPGLINSHEHLIETFFPKIISKKLPYISFFEWYEDRMSASVLLEMKKVSLVDIYLLGCYKNIISGVTTVQDHYPKELIQKVLSSDETATSNLKLSRIKVLNDVALNNNCHLKALVWGGNYLNEYAKAVNNNQPYIIHINEGFDEESLSGVQTLSHLNILGENTLLIHALSCSDDHFKLISESKASITICPSSNFFLYNVIPKIKTILDYEINLSLGTNSTLSGSNNILDELKFCRNVYYETYKDRISDETLVRMVTINPAKALKVDDKIGTIQVGKKADLLLIKSNNNLPYSSLINANLDDISLLISDGKPIYGDQEFSQFFMYSQVKYSKVMLSKAVKVIAGEPLSVLRQIKKAVGYNKRFPFLPIE